MEDRSQLTESPQIEEREHLLLQNGQAASPFAETTTQQVHFPLTPPPASSFPASSRPSTRKRRPTRGKRLALIVLLVSLLMLISSTVLTTLFGGPSSLALPGQIGSLSFTSSGQLDPTSSRGLSDQISLDLNTLSPPASGNRYYAWLLPDKTDDETKPLLLGTLTIHGGQAHLDYTTPDHRNLLATYSRVRITEQPSGTVPVTPSLDPATWRSVGEIPSIPTPGDENQYSLLSHLRHLLASDPTLQAIGLNGGLDIWLYRNAGKLVEYATAARDDWANTGATDLMRREIIRALDYLDGSVYVWQDVPVGTPLLIDPKVGRLGLLEMTPTQNPPGYLAHVDLHLQGLANSPGHTAAQQHLAVQLDGVLSAVTTAMQRIRQDAIQLVRMSNGQLQQPQALALINDMVTNANAVYVGQPDPATRENTGGISFIHNTIQGLAAMEITMVTKGDQ